MLRWNNFLLGVKSAEAFYFRFFGVFAFIISVHLNISLHKLNETMEIKRQNIGNIY